MEGDLHFDRQAQPENWGIGLLSLSYFLLFPIILLAAAAALYFRKRSAPFRIYAFSLTINYFLSLPFFLFFPVPERWAYPGANAVLLSDMLSTKLIEMIRPISGLDNCFPSVHVSFTVLTIMAAYRYRLRYRHTLLCLGGTIILSTFVLGIHWLPDMLMGTLAAVLSFGLTLVLDRRLGFDQGLEPVEEEIPVSTPAPRVAPGKKLAFISYRRGQGSQLARVIHSELERRGIPCFLDVDDLQAEHFDDRLLQEIEKAPNFILVLSPGALDRCREPEDWLRREVVHAMKMKRNIVPLMVEGFQFPTPDQLPEDMKDLWRHNGVTYSHEYFTATLDKLQGFLKIG
jgi:membrane-associated phospholipid phosphatase